MVGKAAVEEEAGVEAVVAGKDDVQPRAPFNLVNGLNKRFAARIFFEAQMLLKSPRIAVPVVAREVMHWTAGYSKGGPGSGPKLCRR